METMVHLFTFSFPVSLTSSLTPFWAKVLLFEGFSSIFWPCPFPSFKLLFPLPFIFMSTSYSFSLSQPSFSLLFSSPLFLIFPILSSTNVGSTRLALYLYHHGYLFVTWSRGSRRRLSSSFCMQNKPRPSFLFSLSFLTSKAWFFYLFSMTFQPELDEGTILSSDRSPSPTLSFTPPLLLSFSSLSLSFSLCCWFKSTPKCSTELFDSHFFPLLLRACLDISSSLPSCW